MKEIAVLLTCHNRKDKTLKCLSFLFKARQEFSNGLELSVYLTDDGSSDGTAVLVKKEFPTVNVLHGDGNLYWSGGMSNSWREALKKKYDAFLLLNDDTYVAINLFDELFRAHEYALKQFSCSGIYIGATKDKTNNSISYSCWVPQNKIFNTYRQLSPNGTYQLCSYGNANIMFVPISVVDKIGILNDKYKHGLADFDYTLTAGKKNIPVLLLPYSIGVCERNKISKLNVFSSLSIKKKWYYLFNPVGFGLSDQMRFILRHFPLRIPIVFFFYFIKIFTYPIKFNLGKQKQTNGKIINR